MLYSLAPVCIVPYIPRAHVARGTTDKSSITLLNQGITTVTKSENRELKYVQTAIASNRPDMAARALATLYRAASARSQRELAQIAAQYGLDKHAEYII